MAKYQFLTEEWVAAAKEIRDKYADEVDAAAAGVPVHQVKMNQVVTDVPFGDGELKAHVDTTSGTPSMDLGHIEGADLTVTIDYATAKAILVEGNPQAGMQAFMSGKIKVQGDMTKLMAMQSAGAGAAGGAADPVAAKVAAEILAITE